MNVRSCHFLRSNAALLQSHSTCPRSQRSDLEILLPLAKSPWPANDLAETVLQQLLVSQPYLQISLGSVATLSPQRPRFSVSNKPKLLHLQLPQTTGSDLEIAASPCSLMYAMMKAHLSLISRKLSNTPFAGPFNGPNSHGMIGR